MSSTADVAARAILPDAQPSPARVRALDGLRGLAVLLVLAIHFTQTAQHPDHSVNLLANWILRAGWIGVDLFFVLSGFLITGILSDARGQAHYFRNFYMRRVLRIFPLYYASLLVLVVLLPALLPPSPALSHMEAESVWYWTYLANVRIAFVGWSEHTYIGHFWTLAVEEQFYLVWPLLVFALSPRAMMRLCIAVIVAALAVRIGLHATGEGLAAYVLTPARFDALAMGGLLALVARQPGGLLRYERQLKLIGVVSAASIVALFIYHGRLPPEEPLVGTVGYTVLAAFFASVVGLAVCSETRRRGNRLWHAPPLVFFGKYSYALYVVHPAIIFFWPSALSPAALESIMGGYWLVGLAASSVFMLAACVAVSLLSWHALEKHFLRFRIHFGDRVEPVPKGVPMPDPAAPARA